MGEADRKSSMWPRACASAAVFRDGAVLLVERGKGPKTGLWSLPGGHIEPGETAAAAAAREVAEETGISARIMGLADINDVIVHDAAGELTAHYVICAFYGAWVSGEPAAASDSRDARFVPLDAIDGLTLTPKGPDIIRSAAALFERARGAASGAWQRACDSNRYRA